MSLLDEAIREHLDLKRRRGADPSEIERAEREALGPVRRHPEAADEAERGHEAAIDESPYYKTSEDEEPYREELYEEPRASRPAEPLAGGQLDGDDPFAADESSGDSIAESGATGRPTPAQPLPHATPHAGEETAEFQVEHEQDRGKDGEDVLEETPEFLQDTPDHDRLWFEQRPPRDFDFEG